MMDQSVPWTYEEFEAVLVTERPRLRRLCWKLTNDGNAADDLAQETLVEAWRHRNRLRDPEAVSGWLSGIARNVCLRWLRAQYRLRAVEVTPVTFDDTAVVKSAWPDEVFDFTLELEREEIATLLDRALALIPAETRSVLIERYVAERSYVEIASLLRMSESSVAVRLHRGKLAMRRALSTDLRDDAAAFGLVESRDPSWRETRIWCTICGERRLAGRFDPEQGDLVLRCPVCYHRHGIHATQAYGEHGLFSGISGFKAAERRVATAANSHFQRALVGHVILCDRCGGPAQLIRRLPPEVPPRAVDQRGLCVCCPGCRHSTWMSLGGLALSLPEARQFVSTLQRVRTLPEREANVGGRDAIVIPFEGVKSDARLAVIIDRETYRTLSVNVEGADTV